MIMETFVVYEHSKRPGWWLRVCGCRGEKEAELGG